MRAYHFTNGHTLRDGRLLPAIGEWLVHSGPIVPCESGLHASKHPFDALQYAPGDTLHLVEIRGEIVEHDTEKVVGRKRKIIKTIDAGKLLRDFARWCALQVVEKWNAPAVVREYLETGNESFRYAANAAAAGYDAWAAECAANDAWDAANDAWAAECAARAAAWAAANDAWVAARAAARAAAWVASRDAQRKKFKQMISAAFK